MSPPVEPPLALAPAARPVAAVSPWWLDPVVGLLIAGVAVEEGAEAWRGDGCCVSSPLDGFACDDDCCR